MARCTYEGRKDTKVVGTRESSIPIEQRSRLLRELDEIDFFNLNFDNCRVTVADAPAVVILASDGGRTARLATWDVDHGDDPDAKVHAALRELADLMDEVTGSRQWVE
jgi:hypothetical protein